MKKKILNEVLQALDIKATKSRMELIEIILGSNDHMSIDDILNKVRKSKSNIGIATVYRTLKLLEDHNFIVKHVFKNNTIVYENTFDKAHHHHLIDVNDGHVIEYENADLEKLIHSIADQLGYELTGHNIELYGRKKVK